MFSHIVEAVAVSGTLASIAYYTVCVLSAHDFLRGNSVAAVSTAKLPVSVLKPLKGADPELYENLRSHFVQDYSQYEIIFGVSREDDPAIPIVNRLIGEFSQSTARIVVCGAVLGNNVKVSNLVHMAREAHYECLVVNDSDIRVPTDYLRSVAAPLGDLGVGMVTCLYRGKAANTLGSRLEALGIETDFAPGVLTAGYLESGIRFGLGSTLALRKPDLAAIGGFEAIVDYLADDYELGHRIAKLGRKVVVSPTVVETYLSPYTFSDFLAHQVRWGRTIRDSRPGGYLGLLFTFGLPWSLAALIAAHGSRWAWVLLACTALARFLMASTVARKVLRDDAILRWLWLLPIRDLVAVFVWVVSFTGNTVKWRSESFHLENGKLIRETDLRAHSS